MKLRGAEYGPIFGASGVQGFFGEGYKHHRILKMIPGYSWDGLTFVAKTTTLKARAGNMELAADGITQRRLLPDCVVARPMKGVMLNAVGLSGPGIRALLREKLWQRRHMPFMISFMSTAGTPEERREELAAFVEILQKQLYEFRYVPALQINFSCPNVGLNPDDLLGEVTESLNIAGRLKTPLIPKFNILFPIDAALVISRSEYCDAICVSNTIPWGKMPDRINWKKLFGTTESPLARYGGGGLSGKPLLPLVSEWVKRARQNGLAKPIMAGGGILKPRDVPTLKDAGANAVFIGSVVNLRPWRVRAIINKAHRIFPKES